MGVSKTNISPLRVEINTNMFEFKMYKYIILCYKETIRKIKPEMAHSQSSSYLIYEQHLTS